MDTFVKSTKFILSLRALFPSRLGKPYATIMISEHMDTPVTASRFHGENKKKSVGTFGPDPGDDMAQFIFISQTSSLTRHSAL